MGSPPVNSTKPAGASLSNFLFDFFGRHLPPPVNVYSLSHHEQRRLHAARRTKMQGTPAKDDLSLDRTIDFDDLHVPEKPGDVSACA